MPERPLVACLGNRMRGDDAAGLRVAELLTAHGVEALRCEGEPISLLELWRGREAALVVDAVEGARPGRIWRLEAPDGGLPALPGGRSSTHLLGLADVIALAASLGRAPRRLTVIGIEGDRFGIGEPPSPEVEHAAETVAAAVLAELERADRRESSVSSTVSVAAERRVRSGPEAEA